MKVFVAGLATETNCFSPIPTGAADFLRAEGGRRSMFSAPQEVFRRLAAGRGWRVAEGLCAWAEPAGPTVGRVYEGLRDEILGALAAAMPVDAVLLNLHGAMVADGYDDCEGDLLERVRGIVGAEVPVGAELDPHCVLTRRMVDGATAIVCYKEYPHIDFSERAEDLFRIIADAAEGKTRPRMTMVDCRMIGTYHTTKEPMKGFVAGLTAAEGRDGVLSVSLAHGFPWSDVPEAGTRVLVVTDGERPAGAALAEDLARRLYALRGTTGAEYLGVAEGLDAAVSATRPVVIGDVSDNPGGGAPGDSTTLLRAMLERGVTNAALGLMWDPVVVGLARAVGTGARLKVRLGGKMGPASGDPLDLAVTVGTVTDDLRFPFGGTETTAGPAAALDLGGIEVAVASSRVQALAPECFTGLGIDPQAKEMVVVKSSQHFRAGFQPIAGEILYVAGAGALDMDFRNLPYRRIERPKWPLDDDPFAD